MHAYSRTDVPHVQHASVLLFHLGQIQLLHAGHGLGQRRLGVHTLLRLLNLQADPVM